MRSMNGTMICRPGSRTRENLPRRSTTHALCCGTMRTPSITTTTSMARTNTAMVADTLLKTNAVATARITAIIVFQNIGATSLCWLFGGSFDDDERLPLLRIDVERGARDGLGACSHPGVPAGAAVLHPREARGLVGPAFQHDGLAAVEEVGAALVGLAVRLVPMVHHQRPADGHAPARERLDECVAPSPADHGRREGAYTQDHQVEGARDELGDDQHQPHDDPKDPSFHQNLLETGVRPQAHGPGPDPIPSAALDAR